MDGDDIGDLERRMARAAAEEDFELAARLRDRIAALRQATLFERQIPGRMGLGTDQQTFKPPEGWVKPKKPDLMTSNTKPRKGPRSR